MHNKHTVIIALLFRKKKKSWLMKFDSIKQFFFLVFNEGCQRPMTMTMTMTMTMNGL